jgi:hypothetical protein
MRGNAAGLTVALITAGLLVGCSSAPPTAYQRYAAAMARVGLQPKERQAQETAWAKGVCGKFASAAENDPDETDLIYPIAVTGAEKNGYTEAQAAAVVRAIIDNFCPQWKVLLRQQG